MSLWTFKLELSPDEQGRVRAKNRKAYTRLVGSTGGLLMALMAGLPAESLPANIGKLLVLYFYLAAAIRGIRGVPDVVEVELSSWMLVDMRVSREADGFYTVEIPEVRPFRIRNGQVLLKAKQQLRLD